MEDKIFFEAQDKVIAQLTKEQILSIPGVMELVVEDCNNAIIEEAHEMQTEADEAAELSAEWDYFQEEV